MLVNAARHEEEGSVPYDFVFMPMYQNDHMKPKFGANRSRRVKTCKKRGICRP